VPPSISRTQGTRLPRFIPQADLVVLDPIWTTAYVTRNHGFMVFDTLYGQDGSYKASPQMVGGHVVEKDGRLRTLTLHDALSRPRLSIHGLTWS
jgi:peptide/nickel transport system substrate-binding protein